MKPLTVKQLKKYLEQCPDNAQVKIGIKQYESKLVDILKSPLNNEKIILVDHTYLKDCELKEE